MGRFKSKVKEAGDIINHDVEVVVAKERVVSVLLECVICECRVQNIDSLRAHLNERHASTISEWRHFLPDESSYYRYHHLVERRVRVRFSHRK